MIAASLSFIACQEEQSVEGPNAKDNEIVFNMKASNGKVDTKSEAEVSDQKFSIPFTSEDGTKFYLEESVTDLDDVFNSPETRGTPAYTENIKTLYGNFKAVAYTKGAGTRTTVLPDAVYTPADLNSDNHTWRHAYSEDLNALFKDEQKSPVQFFMTMPANPTATMTINYTNDEKQTINVTNYESKPTAEAQQDILFATRSIDKDTYSSKTGADILFYHALTGIKFRIDDDAVEAGIKVTKISLSGIRTKGNFTVTSIQEDGGYKDKPTTVYSSRDAVKWDVQAERQTGTVSQTFDGSTTDLSNAANFPESFKKAGTNNINDAQASKTFWLVPQKMAEGITLTIEYTFKGEKETRELGIGKTMAGVEWLPGQLRTYTLTISEVDIEITDDVKGTVKENVVIKNTGNCDEYIRATIVAYWADESGNMISGFTDTEAASDGSGKLYGKTLLNEWKLDDDGKGANAGKFKELFPDTWVYENGYYYCTEAVGPDQPTSTFFEKYSCDNIDVYTTQFIEKEGSNYKYVVNSTPVKAHVVMDIVVQAIEKEGTETYSQAWARAKASNK